MDFGREMSLLLKLCVFDLDGTLVNSLKDLANATNYALEKNGYPVRELEEYRYFLGKGLPLLLKGALGDNYSEEARLRLTDDFNFHYGLHYADCSYAYEGMPGLIDDLKARGVCSAVLSNKPDEFVDVIIKKMYPRADFAVVQGKIDRFPTKPDPSSLLNVLKELGVRKDEALYIGDSNIDIFTGHNAGVKAVGVTWGFRPRSELEEAGADYIVQKPAAILNLVKH